MVNILELVKIDNSNQAIKHNFLKKIYLEIKSLKLIGHFKNKESIIEIDKKKKKS